MQRQARGHFSKDGEIYYYPVTGGEYVYTQELTGSIDSILLTVPIDSASVKRVNIYLSDVNGVETIAPLAEMRFSLSDQYMFTQTQRVYLLTFPYLI